MAKKQNRKRGRKAAGAKQGERRTVAAAGPGPLRVTQGANTEGPSVGLHWITATAPMTHVELARGILDELLGGDVSPGGGGNFYRRSLRWEAGAVLMVEHVSKDVHSCMVRIPGSVLDALGWRGSCELLRRLISCGFRCTRLDVFVDARQGRWRDLQARILDAWQKRQICGVRTPPGERVQHRLDGQVERTVYLGKRGTDGSGRYVRVYDKGFEDGTERRQGEHVRWEAELSDDCAQQAALAIFEAWDDGDDDGGPAGKVAAGVALACVDFRENDGRRKDLVARRPRLRWWSDIIAGLPDLRVVAKRMKATMEGYVQYMRTSVLPKLLRMAEIERITDVGRDLASIAAVLQLLGVEGVRASRGDAITWAFKRDCVPI